MRKIAVVEDNEDNRVLVRALLEENFQLVEYESGPEALEGLKKDKPDLVLLDISLPGMSGVEALAQIRADVSLKNLQVIALTAHAMVGDREKYLAHGFNDYVTKPITDESLLHDAIKRCLGDPP